MTLLSASQENVLSSLRRGLHRSVSESHIVHSTSIKKKADVVLSKSVSITIPQPKNATLYGVALKIKDKQKEKEDEGKEHIDEAQAEKQDEPISIAASSSPSSASTDITFTIPIPPPLPPAPVHRKSVLSRTRSPSSSSSSSSASPNVASSSSASTLVPATTVTCPVCFEDVKQVDVFQFDPCRHEYCKECIKEHLKILVSFGKKPFCLHPGCTSKFPADMASSFLDKVTYERYCVLLKTPPGVHRWCPRPGCDTPVIKSDVSPRSPQVTCKNPACQLVFCYECRVKWHEGDTCKQYKEKQDAAKPEPEVLSEKFAKENCQECPQCSIWVEKIDGCAYVQCLACHHEFCWDCLEPHDHNMSAHIHGPRYKGPRLPLGHRHRRAMRIAKYAGIGVAVCVLGPPALALGAAAATVVLPVLAVNKIHRHIQRKKQLRKIQKMNIIRNTV